MHSTTSNLLPGNIYRAVQEKRDLLWILKELSINGTHGADQGDFHHATLVFLSDKVGVENRCFQQRVAMKYTGISPVPVTW